MRITAALGTALTIAWAGTVAPSAIAQDHQHSMTGAAAVQGDSRQLVPFPEPMRLHTITSAMRRLPRRLSFALNHIKW